MAGKRKPPAPEHPGRIGPVGVPVVRCALCPDVPGRARVRFHDLNELSAHEQAMHGFAPAGPHAARPRVECRPSSYLSKLPISQWSDPEVLKYVAFVFDSAAHLAGGFGALTPRHCMAFAARLRRIGCIEEEQDG